MKNNSFIHLLLAFACLFFLQKETQAQGVLDQPFTELGWQSWRGMSESDYEKKLDDLKADGYRPIDVEVSGGSKRTYAAIWRKNSDSRKWVVKTKLTDAEFHQQWTNYKNQGYRPADQETHQVGNTRYFGAIWIENKENLGWYSFRNQTSDEFHQKYEELKGKYLPVDVDAYEVGNQMRYSAIWLENKENIGWYIKRNLSPTELDKLFDEQSDKGFRLYDIEGYESGNKVEYAAIFVKESKGRKWYGRWGMTDTWFRNYWAQYRDMGFRIEDIEVYQTSAGTRYAGVWVENSDKVQWSEKDEVNKLVDDYLKQNPTAGMSVAVAVNGKIKYERGFGFADVSASKQADSETIYRLASVSKGVTGVLAFRLKDKGKIDLSKKTRDYESRLPAHHTHTVGQLLSNRGKVRHYLEGGDPLSDGTIAVYASAYDATKLFSADPLVNGAYLYSTHGYTCAAAAIEKKTGKTFSKLLQEEISSPFGVTSLRCENLATNLDDRSKIYSAANNGTFSEVTPQSLSWKFAGGGMESSASDLARFGIRLLKGDIINNTSLNAMTTAPDNAKSYGYGWDLGTENGTKVFAKGGAQPGSRAYIRCYPEKKIVIVLLCNTRGDGITDLGRAIGKELLD